MKHTVRILFSFRAVVTTFCIAIVYIGLTAFFPNNHFLIETFTSRASSAYKIRISYDLFMGIFTAFGKLQGVLLLITAFLVGINLTLLRENIAALHKQGRIRLSVGGMTAISLMGSGCSSCGVSLLSFFAPSAAVIFPSQGAGLQLIGILFLTASLIYTGKQLTKPLACKTS